MAGDLIICRCEGITLSRIQEAVAEGACTAHAVKIATRAGMGVCQGRTCRCLVESLVGGGQEPRPITIRTPVRPVPLSRLALGAGEEEGRSCES
ncbi:MAG: (2Fe-2S)-binding protein [Bacillota bacterium]